MEVPEISLSFMSIEERDLKTMKKIWRLFVSNPNNIRREKDMIQEEQMILECVLQRQFLFGQQVLENISNKVQQISYIYFGLRNGEQCDQRYISARHERLVQTLGVQNATANSIRHASSTELAAQGFDGRTINVVTHYTSYLKMNKEYYIFAVNRDLDSIASALISNHGEMQNTQTISKYMGEASVSEGDVPQQSLFGDEIYLSLQESLASPLSLPIISTQNIVEAESLNDYESAKVQKSQTQKDNPDVEPQEEAYDSRITKDSV
ncbi:MAG: hypothetical protein EZS28_008902 [Streblomastix strix]|uniref:Uncharacterized protein n=1 Tax=Streblomastix strix TaxID=222440 RepID=A0A5J4WKJ8_9EUKA|nr:MAG: hypothetical protein EZS28_008902 [Streblomastix strix]